MRKVRALLMLVGLLFVLLACKKGKTYPDSQDGLKQLATDLSAASDDDSAKMGKELTLPNADKWFAATFGPELGPKLATEYSSEAAKLPTIGSFFKAAKAKGKSDLLIEKHMTADDDGANILQEEAIKAMKTPVPLYTINAVEPGKTIGSSLWSFVYVDGNFRYVGKLKAVKPGATPLDELSKKDLKDALKGE